MSDFFQLTGHCEGCGQPRTYCLCPPSRPCKCRLLHEMGSGLKPGALDQFADIPPAVVGDDQGELFGETA